MPDCGELDAPGLVDPTSVPNRRNARTVGRAIIVRRPWARGESSALFAAQCVLQSANRILHLASSLVGLAFSFQLLIAEDLAGGFLYGSLDLLCRTFDSILIHVVCSLFVRYFRYATSTSRLRGQFDNAFIPSNRARFASFPDKTSCDAHSRFPPILAEQSYTDARGRPS